MLNGFQAKQITHILPKVLEHTHSLYHYKVTPYTVSNEGVLSLDTAFNIFEELLFFIKDNWRDKETTLFQIDFVLSHFDLDSQIVCAKILSRNLGFTPNKEWLIEADIIHIKPERLCVPYKRVEDHINFVDGTWLFWKQTEGERFFLSLNQNPLLAYDTRGKNIQLSSRIQQDLLETFDSVMGKGYIITGVLSDKVLVIDDIYTLSEVLEDRTSPTQWQRFMKLKELFNKSRSKRNLKLAKYRPIRTIDDLKVCNKIRRNSTDFCFLVRDVPFQAGRSKHFVYLPYDL